jgi:hypothetical protein
MTTPESCCPEGIKSVVFISVAIATAQRIIQITGNANNFFIKRNHNKSKNSV